MGRLHVTPLLRATWHEMMACSEVSAVAVRVGIRLGMFFDNNTAETYVGFERIAAELGIGSRTAWGAVHELKDAGLLEVRRGGRGNNHYRMPIENVAAECEIKFGQSRTRLRDLDQTISQPTARLKQEISQNPANNLAVGCELSLTSSFSKKKNSTRAGARASAERGYQHREEASEGRVTRGVYIQSGTPEFEAWKAHYREIGAQKGYAALVDAEATGKGFMVAALMPPKPKPRSGVMAACDALIERTEQAAREAKR